MKYFYTFIISMLLALSSAAQPAVRGTVLHAADSSPLSGASVKAGNTGVLTNEEGEFSIAASGGQVRLRISYVGFKSIDTLVQLPLRAKLQIRLSPSGELEAVTVNTGYQELPRERSTGSFSRLDQEQLNRRVSTDILSRIEDMVPGLLFNRGPGPATFNVRGQNTINSNPDPLIILDNFPYDGNLSTINPNDIESVTVLKDAAAASIWGARAGNGVVVITSKKGKYGQAPVITFNTNFTAGEKPDLFYQPKMPAAAYIEIEQRLFAQGFYRSTETSTLRTQLSPVVELLIAKRDGLLPAAEADARIEALKGIDNRNDAAKYLYRNSSLQQYSLGIRGGGENQQYYVSAGYDHSLASLRGNANNRYTLNATNTYRFLKNRLELSAGILYLQTNADVFSQDAVVISPYERLADDNGNPVAVTRDYRTGYLASVRQNYPGLLDWQYRPLEELQIADNTESNRDIRLLTNLRYRIATGFNAEVIYQYGNNAGSIRNHQSLQSYYTRNQINRITSLGTGNTLVRPMPLGGILDLTNSGYESNRLRGQLGYSASFRSNTHVINALAGAEVNDVHTRSERVRYFGYDDEHALPAAPVDYTRNYPLFVAPASTGTVTYNDVFNDGTDRFISFYGNAAYTYKNRYTVSGSARKDQSNIFGVDANLRGVPLWSAGASWLPGNEDFYHLSFLPYLKLRITHGVSGNVNRSYSAYTTARYASNAFTTGLPYASITNPPNPQLRWEKVAMTNLAADFGTKANRITGSFEYYFKKGSDLLGSAAVAPQTGVTTYAGNYAATKGQGFDFNVNVLAVDRAVRWNATYFLSHLNEEVTRYETSATAATYAAGSLTPFPGQPLYPLNSYRWYGLNPQTGDPVGYLNGQISTNYSSIVSQTKPQDLVFHGTSTPTWFGALRNTVSWKGISASANVTYRLGYYFRRSTIAYGSNQGLNSHPDYLLRWQKPGDEASTQVPSLPAASNSSRDNLYRYSEALVEKGDHLRLQDVNLSYDLSPQLLKQVRVKRVQFYLYANNLGILWKATDADRDPDYSVSLPVRTISGGLKVDF
jgi:TonB-dependent starch-binding outer membrane protein SusC